MAFYTFCNGSTNNQSLSHVPQESRILASRTLGDCKQLRIGARFEDLGGGVWNRPADSGFGPSIDPVMVVAPSVVPRRTLSC